MEYKLAKELKDAGFPIGLTFNGSFLDSEGKKVKDRVPSDTDVYIPTLSELIEACGEEFRALKWFKNDKSWGAFTYERETELLGSGRTPEEAVSRLYIALNK